MRYLARSGWGVQNILRVVRMVSKIAVMALVAMVAIPIGLGYAMNLQDSTETRWNVGQSTNVTPLLQNSQYNEYVQADPYAMNSNVFMTLNFGGSNTPNTVAFYPEYLSTTTAKSTLELDISQITPTANPGRPSVGGEGIVFDNIKAMTIYTGYNPYDYPGYTREQTPTIVLDGYNNYYITAVTIYQIIDISQNPDIKAGLGYIQAWEYVSPGNYNPTFYSFGTTYIAFRDFGAYTWDYSNSIVYTVYDTPTGSEQGINLVDGYRLDTRISNWSAPGQASQIITTFDLSKVGKSFWVNSHTGIEGEVYAGYRLNYAKLDIDGALPTFNGQELIYNSGEPNVYQLIASKTGYELRYIGNSWPTNFGEANYYRSWTVPYTDLPTDHPFYNPAYPQHGVARELAPNEYMRTFQFQAESGSVDIGQVRFDQALIKSRSISVIENNTYNPANITGSADIQTKINNVSLAGTSLVFGGNTYDVTGTAITVNDRKVSLNDIVLRSIYNDDSGQYDNMINGAVVSSTAAPSTITFNGQWAANITSAPLTSEQVNVTRWVPGGWAWNGLDANFAVVGLLTCAGAFIGLGMYGQRSGQKVGTLMLVCAGGAMVFLALL